MGQRHQIFVKIANPVKAERNYMSKEDKAKANKIFGRGKYTVIALHHQWLYGRSAVCNIANILNVTNEETMASYSIFDTDGMINSLDEYIKNIMMMFQVQTNPLHPRGIGIERMHLLNDQCLDEKGKYNSNWDMRKDFLGGDNNDGITIIDAVERKYCMMNINTYEGGYDDNDDENTGVCKLPSVQPVSALEYANAYYPEDKGGNGKYIFDIGLNDVEILTMKELANICPKNFKKSLVVSE